MLVCLIVHEVQWNSTVENVVRFFFLSISYQSIYPSIHPCSCIVFTLLFSDDCLGFCHIGSLTISNKRGGIMVYWSSLAISTLASAAPLLFQIQPCAPLLWIYAGQNTHEDDLLSSWYHFINYLMKLLFEIVSTPLQQKRIQQKLVAENTTSQTIKCKLKTGAHIFHCSDFIESIVLNEYLVYPYMYQNTV